mgnify:CR=1 FL=1
MPTQRGKQQDGELDAGRSKAGSDRRNVMLGPTTRQGHKAAFWPAQDWRRQRLPWSFGSAAVSHVTRVQPPIGPSMWHRNSLTLRSALQTPASFSESIDDVCLPVFTSFSRLSG